MKDKLLTKGMGVTWGCLEDTPEAGFPEESFRPDGKDLPEDAVAKFLWKPASEVEAAKARAAAEALPTPPDPLPEVVRLPQYPVSIECVTDNPSIHYFNMTRLGGYLAMPLVYKSYYTEQALNEAKGFLKAKRKEEEDDAAKLEELKKKAEENDEPIPDALPVDPDKVVKVLQLTPELTKRVLCLDTLGANRKIDNAHSETSRSVQCMWRVQVAD